MSKVVPLQQLCIARLVEQRGDDANFMAAVKSATKGAMVAARIIQWAMVSNELGRVATTAEYAEHWSVTERTGWNHRALIHEAFPGDELERIVSDVAREIATGATPDP